MDLPAASSLSENKKSLSFPHATGGNPINFSTFITLNIKKFCVFGQSEAARYLVFLNLFFLRKRRGIKHWEIKNYTIIQIVQQKFKMVFKYWACKVITQSLLRIFSYNLFFINTLCVLRAFMVNKSTNEKSGLICSFA